MFNQERQNVEEGKRKFGDGLYHLDPSGERRKIMRSMTQYSTRLEKERVCVQ